MPIMRLKAMPKEQKERVISFLTKIPGVKVKKEDNKYYVTFSYKRNKFRVTNNYKVFIGDDGYFGAGRMLSNDFASFKERLIKYINLNFNERSIQKHYYADEDIVTASVNRVFASTSRKFRFSDGSIITASCVEEAKEKHKVTAAISLKDLAPLFSKKNVRLDKTAGGDFELVLVAGDNNTSEFDGMWLGDIIKKGNEYWFHSEGLDCALTKENISKIKKKVNEFIQYEIDKMDEKKASLKALKF